MTQSAQVLRQRYGPWGNHPDYPVEAWLEDVNSDSTRLGYWDWVEARLEDDAEYRITQYELPQS